MSALEIQSFPIVSIAMSLLPYHLKKGRAAEAKKFSKFYHLGPQIVVPVTFLLEHISPRAEPS